MEWLQYIWKGAGIKTGCVVSQLYKKIKIFQMLELPINYIPQELQIFDKLCLCKLSIYSFEPLTIQEFLNMNFFFPQNATKMLIIKPGW